MDTRVNPVVQLAAVSVDRSGRRVVHDVDLAVRRGSWSGLIGANGSGKTTLLRAISGRLPFSAGSCHIDGEETVSDRAARATYIDFAPPADRLPDALRGRELLELVGGRLETLWPRLGPLRVALALDGLLDRWIGDSSAGMRQRLAIAAAFINGRGIVVLDEPFNWLDPVAVFDLRLALRQMVDDGLTLITALHDLRTLVAECDHGVILADGRVALELDGDGLRSGAQDAQAFERQMIALLRSKRAGD